MSKRPMYRLRSVQCNDDGMVSAEDTGYGIMHPSLAGKTIKTVEITIPDLIDEGDVVVVARRIGGGDGHSFTYLQVQNGDLKEFSDPE